MSLYTQADVLRILRLTRQQLNGWRRAGLVTAGSVYSFTDLIQIKKVRDLRAMRLRPKAIRSSMLAMQRQVVGMSNPLLEAESMPVGSQIAWRHKGRIIEPVTGQFVMDFGPAGMLVTAERAPVDKSGAAAECFALGVRLEEQGEAAAAVEQYQMALEADPNFAAAYINLGTIRYNLGDCAGAERCYRQALERKPDYALAHFNIGNVLDERGQLREAAAAYKEAVRLAPRYADAHYNLALTLEKMRLPRLALRHWKSYVRLEPRGAWGQHARMQIRRILDREKLQLVTAR